MNLRKTWLFLTLSMFGWLTFGPSESQAAPPTIVIQGKLESGAGALPTGSRQFRIRFFDAPTAGMIVSAGVDGQLTVTDAGRFAIAFVPSPSLLAADEIWYELSIDGANPPDGTVDAEDQFADRIRLNSDPFSLLSGDSETLGGVAAGDFATDADLASGLGDKADATHKHDAPEIGSGVLDNSRIPGSLIRVTSIFSFILNNDGPGSAFDADLLDGADSTAFATDAEVGSASADKADSTHTHDAADIATGVLADARLTSLIARDDEITSTLLANDGASSTLDADLLDGLDSGAYSTDIERDAAVGAAIAGRDAAIAAALAAHLSIPAAPAAPTELRLLPSLRAAPYRRLMWNISSFGGMASFIVYESSAPITDGNKASAVKRFVSTTELELAIFANSGMRYFRVAALNFLGGEGPLSNEYGLDTTPRIAYRADQELDQIFELFVAPAEGGGTAVKVNAPLLTVSDVDSFKFSPDGTRIVYRADQETDEMFELYVAPASGGGTAVKVNSPLIPNGDVPSSAGFLVDSFRFSPDGSRIAYLADQETDELFELYVAPAAGGGAAVKVSLPDTQTGPFAFSPDGARIAFVAFSLGISELYVASVSGVGAPVKVNSAFVRGGGGLEGVLSFGFSPDGARIAYHGDQDADNVFELFVAPASGGGANVKVNSTLIFNGNVFPGASTFLPGFDFSPDGSRLAYRANQESVNIELYVAPAGGGGANVKVNPSFAAGANVQAGLAFSPDGVGILYRADQDTSNAFELFVAPGDGGGATLKINPDLPPGRDVEEGFAFSPDAARIAYRANQDSSAFLELYSAPASGGGATVKINTTPVIGGNVMSFAFSPDGERLLYLADQGTDEVFELFVAPAAGGSPPVKVNPALITNGDVTQFAFSPLGFVP